VRQEELRHLTSEESRFFQGDQSIGTCPTDLR
jgi:hypothetical protein